MNQGIIPVETFQFLYQQGSLFPYQPQSLDEIVWPSSHKSGIPDLDPEMIATDIPEPFKIWGDISRREVMSGTYGFIRKIISFGVSGTTRISLLNPAVRRRLNRISQ